MVFFNYALRKLNAKIVYYGPGLCGKTTNLVWIHDHFEGGERGKMISLATEGDRTIFFDLLPLEIGAIRGMDVTLQLYTVPGQVHYNSTRQLVLRGADGVVFVADSQRAMQSSNVDSFKNLQENLLLQGISLDGFPHVLQFNKRDLRDIVPVEELNDELNHYSVPIFEATATEGVGVQETLEGIVKLVMRNLRQRYEGATTGARTPGIDDSQVSIPEAPPTPPPGPAEVPSPEVPEAPAAVAETPPPVEPIVPPEPPAEITFDPEPPPPEEPAVAPEAAPPEEPVAPLEMPPEPPPLEEVAPLEEIESVAEGPPPPAEIPVGDPAETVDFSKAAGSDPFGGLGGGFEDEVSTAVYDTNDDSAIDFEELKQLDAERAAPTPPPAETSQVAAPSFETGRPVADTFDSGAEQAASDFDLDSTDSKLKTQQAAEPDPQESMAAFDPNAPAPDMDSIPDFELDMPEPEPPPVVPEPEPVAPAEEVAPSFEPEPIAEPEPPAVPEFAPAGEDFTPTEAAPPPSIEGAFEDRIDAPSPFAPNPDAPGGSPEVLEALSEPPATAAEKPPVEPVPEVTPAEPVPEPAPVQAVPDGIDISSLPEALPADEEPEIEFIDDSSEVPPVEALEEIAEAVPADVEDAFAEVELPEPADVRAQSDVIDEELFDAIPAEPIVVGNDDPWTEEELSGVYDLAEVEKAEAAAAIEAAEPRPVDVSAEDNQLHLRLKGTGAIIESGQVRALDIEVPVPGSWVGNRRVTLQLRLTLTPDTEVEDDGTGNTS
jgi:signal recognition particle receptor subunit beta